ncbi:Molybdopterin synthase catalytic subunit [Umbelopsis nana]
MAATYNTYIQIFNSPLPSLDEASRLVASDGAGAISTFSGTTRDHFQGKRVLKLQYEGYEPMAERILHDIVNEARNLWDIQHVLVYHRLKEVPIGEASVVIAVSSAHRKEAMKAVEYLIDELKARCPIWKKEFYLDGSLWKGTCEGCTSNKDHRHGHSVA